MGAYWVLSPSFLNIIYSTIMTAEDKNTSLTIMYQRMDMFLAIQSNKKSNARSRLTLWFNYIFVYISLWAGHCFAGGAMIACTHDLRVMNNEKGWISFNEVFINMRASLFAMKFLQWVALVSSSHAPPVSQSICSKFVWLTCTQLLFKYSTRILNVQPHPTPQKCFKHASLFQIPDILIFQIPVMQYLCNHQLVYLHYYYEILAVHVLVYFYYCYEVHAMSVCLLVSSGTCGEYLCSHLVRCFHHCHKYMCWTPLFFCLFV